MNLFKPRKRIVNHDSRFTNYCTVAKERKAIQLGALPSKSVTCFIYTKLVCIAQRNGSLTISDMIKVMKSCKSLGGGFKYKADDFVFKSTDNDSEEESVDEYLSKYDDKYGIIIPGNFNLSQIKDEEIEVIYKPPKAKDLCMIVLKKHPTLIIFVLEEDK